MVKYTWVLEEVPLVQGSTKKAINLDIFPSHWDRSETFFLRARVLPPSVLEKARLFFHQHGYDFGPKIDFEKCFIAWLDQLPLTLGLGRVETQEEVKDGAMDNAKLAAIQGFLSSAPTGSTSTGPSLKAQHKAMSNRRGKKVYPKACEGPVKCKNVLCDHKYTAVGTVTQGPAVAVPAAVEYHDDKIDPNALKIVMKKCEDDGYTVSETFAVKKMQENGYKIVPAIKKIKEDLDVREYTLHQTGRVNIPYERHAASTCPSANTSISACSAHQANGLPRFRDNFVAALEAEDIRLAETLTKGWSSYYGKAIASARYKNQKARDDAFKVYTDEARYRQSRQRFWEEAMKQGFTMDEVEVCMEKWEEVNKADDGFAGLDGRTWRKDTLTDYVQVSSAATGAASSSGSSSANNAETPKSKVYPHPLTTAPIIIEGPTLSPVAEEAEETEEPVVEAVQKPVEHNTTLPNSKKLWQPPPGYAPRISERNLKFIQQKEADKARYAELMDSIADDDVKITALRLQANQLLQENRELQGVNWELKFRATERLLEAIDNPPEPQIIHDLVCQIADWDLKFMYVLSEDDGLPMLCSDELYDLLDKLCKNIYLVSIQTISLETRPAIRRAWEEINFGGRTFFQAMKLAIIISRGLLEDTLGDKLAKTVEMAMLLDETFKNLDIELPVLNRKDKRNRVEDKRLQGLLKQTLAFSMKVCQYPTDLSWHGITKLRFEVGDGITLQEQMESKYKGLASANPPTETMNKANAATYCELIKKARAIDDLLKARADDPVAKYKQMLGVWYDKKEHPASTLACWKTLIKDEDTHNMMALLMLIAVDEPEGRFTQVIQLFRECIHDDLHNLHKFVKKDPEAFCEKTNVKYLTDVIGDPGQLRWHHLTDQQIWAWILNFQIAKSRLGGDVKGVLGWATYFGGMEEAKKAVKKAAKKAEKDSIQKAVQKIVEKKTVEKSPGKVDVTPMHQGLPDAQRKIITPRRVQESLGKALSIDTIEAKVGENESLEDAIERQNLEKGERFGSGEGSSQLATGSGTNIVEELSGSQTEAMAPKQDGLATVNDADVTTLNELAASLNLNLEDPEIAKTLAAFYKKAFEVGKAGGAASDTPLSEKAKGKQPARD